MKILLYLLTITFFLTGCAKKYIQVFETKSTNTIKQKEFFVYETDTLKITYSFWSKKGILSFSIYNKLNKPIYIDWKKSSYIDNSNKFNYWVDEERSNSIDYYGGYYYDGPLLKTGYTVNEGATLSSSSKVKVERITFIPPKSNYYRSQFYLIPINSFKLRLKNPGILVKRNDRANKKNVVYSRDFTSENSPLKFRNFITFSFSEDFKNEFYVDNGFYISNLKEMDSRHFAYFKRDNRGRYITDNKGALIYETPFKKLTSFYVNVPKTFSINYRKRFNLP